jgi:hypothetical protein
MTIEEVKEKKEILQGNIFTLLSHFEQEAGVQINEINLTKVHWLGATSLVSHVVNVNIPITIS